MCRQGVVSTRPGQSVLAAYFMSLQNKVEEVFPGFPFPGVLELCGKMELSVCLGWKTEG